MNLKLVQRCSDHRWLYEVVNSKHEGQAACAKLRCTDEKQLSRQLWRRILYEPLMPLWSTHASLDTQTWPNVLTASIQRQSLISDSGPSTCNWNLSSSPPPPVGLYANSHPQTRDSSKIRRSQNDCDSAVVQMSLGRDYRIAAVGRPVVWP